MADVTASAILPSSRSDYPNYELVLTHGAVAKERKVVMSRISVAPFLIAKDVEGQFRITIRETRYNSQNYPIVTATSQPEKFKTATLARAHAKLAYGAEAGQFATK